MIDGRMLKRFIVFDRTFQLKAAVVVALMCLIRWEGFEEKRLEAARQRLSVEQLLVAKIPAMESQLAQRTRPVAPPQGGVLKKEENGFRLEGILVTDHGMVALVNGEIRTVGDVVGLYEIVQINKDGVAVADRQTGLIEVMTIPHESSVSAPAP